MKHLFTLKSLLLTLVMLCGLNAWGATTLFHETFGDNSGKARVWDDSYSVKSGIEAVYSSVTGYTITNAKQSKNTVGAVASGLVGTQNKDASIVIGPLNAAACSEMVLTYKWKAGSIKGTYTTSASYATSADGEYVSLEGTGTGATSFVERKYTLPVEAQVSTLYLKIVWCTSNTQAVIDEVDLSGVYSESGFVAAPVITETSKADQDGKYYTTSTATATIACATEGATIQYAITGNDVTDPTTIETWTEGASVSITSDAAGTKILWAKAVKDADESSTVSKVFTFIEKPELITYEQVTSESQIVPGRKYVIACTGASKMAVMSAISGKIFSAKNTDATTITCADSKLSFIKGDAVYVTFEKAAASFANGHADNLATTIWNVKIGDEYITSTTEKNMVMSADAPTNITMSIDAEGNFALKFDVNYFCYNAGSPRFTTYDSQGTSINDMKIQLFREPEAMASVMSATAETAVELPVSVVGRKVFGNYLLASTVNNGGAQLESPSLAEAKHFWSNDPEKFNQESWIAIAGLDDNYVGKEFEVGQTLTAAGADAIYGFPTYTVATPNTSDYAGALAINNYSASNFNIGGKDEAVTNVWLVAPQLGEYCQIHGYVGDGNADGTVAKVQANEESSSLTAIVYHNGLSDFTPGWYNIEGVVAKDGEGLAIYATAVDTATGVEGVETSSVKVYGAEGVINVESEEVAPIAVYSANGAIVSSVEASSASIAVAPGFYIVKAGNSVSKVTVK